MTGRTTAASLVVSVCLVLAAVAGGLPLASGPALAQSGSLELQNDITEQDDFVVAITNLDGINTGYLVVDNLDNQHRAFEESVDAGREVVLSPADLGGLNASETVEATLYESDALDTELDSEQTNVSGFTGSFGQDTYSVTQGNTVELDVTVSNPGDAGTSENVSLVLNSTVGTVETRSVSVAAGGSEQLTMTWDTTDFEAGSYTAEVVSQYDGDVLDLAVIEVQEPDPAYFAVSLDGTNSPVTAGERLDVTATITNTGDESGSQEVDLRIGEPQVDSTTVSLGGGNSTTVTLSWQTGSGDAGEYEAAVSSANETDDTLITVTEPVPANFTVSLASTNSPVTEGERLDVTATITNTGDLSGTQEIALLIGGSPVDSTNVSLAGGDSTTVTLSWQTGNGDAGEYEAAVSSANESDDTLVTVTEPAHFAVSLDSTNSPVTEGERLDVSATITNIGDEAGSQEIRLSIDGSPVDSTTVSLAGGDSTTVPLSWQTGPADAGLHRATVASADRSDGTSVQVYMHDSPTPIPTETPTDTPTRSPTETSTPTPTEITTDTPTATDSTTETTTASPGGTTATTTVPAGADGGTQERRQWDVEIESTTSPVNAGDPLQVTATLTNLGEDFASTELLLSVGGDRTDVRGMSLAGGAAETVTLTWETESGDAGEYAAAVAAGEGTDEDTDEASVEVHDADDAIFDVQIDSTTPPGASDNGSLVVTATVTNGGATSDTQEVSLAVGGVQRDSETMTLEGGESRTVAFTWEPADFDETSVEVRSDDDEATVSVGPGGGGGSPLSDPLLIGLLLLLLLALAVVVYSYVRRRQHHRGQEQ